MVATDSLYALHPGVQGQFHEADTDADPYNRHPDLRIHNGKPPDNSPRPYSPLSSRAGARGSSSRGSLFQAYTGTR